MHIPFEGRFYRPESAYFKRFRIVASCCMRFSLSLVCVYCAPGKPANFTSETYGNTEKIVLGNCIPIDKLIIMCANTNKAPAGTSSAQKWGWWMWRVKCVRGGVKNNLQMPNDISCCRIGKPVCQGAYFVQTRVNLVGFTFRVRTGSRYSYKFCILKMAWRS